MTGGKDGSAKKSPGFTRNSVGTNSIVKGGKCSIMYPETARQEKGKG